MSIVLFVDGVLRTETKVPIFEGISVYRALNTDATVFLAVDDEKEAERWCQEHKFTNVDGFIDNSKVKTKEDKNFAKVEYLRAQGPIFLVITADMELAKTCIENGVRVFMFLHPKYLNMKFRPDGRQGRKNWDAIKEELDAQLEMLAEDKRL